MKIRPATTDDLNQIAQVHKICFPNNFSTQLGSGFSLQSKFYAEYLNKVPELFLVAENDEQKIVGFCMGYYCEENHYTKSFFRHNLCSIMLRMTGLLLSGNSQAWVKMKTIFQKRRFVQKLHTEFDHIPIEKQGDLLSICVLPEYRGGKTGTAQTLIEEYQAALKRAGKTMCVLTVEESNGRGIHFYERNHFIQWKKFNVKDDELTKITYAKML